MISKISKIALSLLVVSMVQCQQVDAVKSVGYGESSVIANENMQDNNNKMKNPTKLIFPFCRHGCAKGYQCIKGRCVKINMNECGNKKCQNWQICVEGKCTNRCAIIICKSGSCFQGKCQVNIKPIDPCAFTTCAVGFLCDQGKCYKPIDLCQDVRCESNFKCQNGQCVLDKQEWPQCFRIDANKCKNIIEQQFKGVNVFILPLGSPVTKDFRTDRVRIFVDNYNIVAQIPRIG